MADVTANYFLTNGEGGIVFGRGTLTPDPIGGYLYIPLPDLGYSLTSFAHASYDLNAPFNLANIGTLLCQFTGSGASLVLAVFSTNVNDGNGVRWIAVR